MENRLYTLHRHARSGDLEVVGEPGWLAVIPPLWALYEGLWLTLGLQAAFLAAVFWLAPLALSAAYLALVLITVFDGNMFHRLELRLRGWREVGCVEAQTPEGAEELFLKGALQ
ncbi:hypothetical protein LNKW23_17330 [Paralimibaculum aggregatum]|uniref:DUF2628 domain-containing protein n=1 Tax=Paralimibaculum aggregatum TaxID=3036245 RepID=A0ABQ6LJX1_9RHOB|nr:hypothetical protein [Limibaculum sp. NKW23]GMG82520.1 hypothetical protein LNKW23_17330 [Limibaculum sp. NKW23]